MKLALSVHIRAPRNQVWRLITDPEAIQAAAAHNGIRATRRYEGVAPGAGLAWDLQFRFKGNRLTAEAYMADLRPPERLRGQIFVGPASGMGDVSGTVLLELDAVDAEWTLMRAEVKIGANSLAGRILFKPLQLAKGRLKRRAQRKFDDLALAIETRLRPNTSI